VLEVAGLRAGYGRIRILDGVSFGLRAGEVVGVLGHNGMGKTTLLRTLIGQLRASGGTIAFDGRAITRLSMFWRARLGIGYVPQGRDIFPQLTVLENLRLGEEVRRGDSAIPEMLDYFPALKPLLDRHGRALSGGEQQILALARCLVGRPRLVLLDEPTEGIQPSIIKDNERAIRALAATGDMAILLVEQYYDFARSLADQYLLMERGEIVRRGAGAQMDSDGVKALLSL
jgi:urea ABC transporter ATP-binding protein UrtE